MPEFVPDDGMFQGLKGKVFVLTGGASGIGASLVRLLNRIEAHVVFGDLAESAGIKLAKELDKQSARVTFVKVDTTIYGDVVRLFQMAIEIHSRTDHAIAGAAILGEPALWTPDLTLDNIEKEPDARPLDVNLKGTAYFARVALAFLNANNAAKEDRSLTLISSVMQLIGVGVSPLYQVGKAGVYQLMRTLRPLPPGSTTAAVRINSVHPNVTITPMVEGPLTEAMEQNSFPLNTSKDVARLLTGIAAQSHLERNGAHGKQIHGMAFEITGGKSWEFEEDYERAVKDWTGTENFGHLEHIRSIFVGMGMSVWNSH